MMARYRLLPGLVGLACCAAVMMVPGQAARADATVRLVGRVLPHATVQFGGGKAVITIDFSQPQAQYTLFSLLDSTNGGEGYTISVVSTNASDRGVLELLPQDKSSPPVPYSLEYNGQTLHFEDGVAVVKTVGGDSKGNGSGDVVLVPRGGVSTAGAYTETLEFVIKGK